MKFPPEDDDTTDMQSKILKDLRKLNCSENKNEESEQQWIKKYSKLGYYKVLSDDNIISRVVYGSEEWKNFEECPKSRKKNLVTCQRFIRSDTLVHNESLTNNWK